MKEVAVELIHSRSQNCKMFLVDKVLFCIKYEEVNKDVQISGKNYSNISRRDIL
jgi:hypothetical protein